MRGEGNHKIPGSFAPENMEKTGAERVKYSLACQHEDAIPIKFVSYAQKCPTVLCTFAVALRKESVDRNFGLMGFRVKRKLVALRKESVDRNTALARPSRAANLSLSARRAWIEMAGYRASCSTRIRSLSARREWIEIRYPAAGSRSGMVALRKESVDRNLLLISNFWVSLASLSVRRAWREISTGPSLASFDNVALRKESVDRNPKQDGNWGWGEESLSARRAWIEIGDQ